MENKALTKTIEFNRPAKYKALKRLGAGACGETILVYERNRDKRYKYFSLIKNEISSGKFEQLSFSLEETLAYRSFADSLCDIMSSIDQSSKFQRDYSWVIEELETIYRQSMLEAYVPSPDSIASVFIDGTFWYRNGRSFPTESLRDFLSMLKSMPSDKKSIVLDNLVSRLDAVAKTKPKSVIDDDIPF